MARSAVDECTASDGVWEAVWETCGAGFVARKVSVRLVGRDVGGLYVFGSGSGRGDVGGSAGEEFPAMGFGPGFGAGNLFEICNDRGEMLVLG